MKVSEIMSRNIFSLQPDDTVGKALNIMEKNRVHQILVMKDNSLQGMLLLKDIIKKAGDTNEKIKNLLMNIPTIDGSADAEEAAEILLNSGMRALPVKEKNKIVGIVSETDLIKLIEDGSLRNIISECEHTSESDTIGKVKNTMMDANVSRIPVLNAKGELAGVVDTLDMIKIFKDDTYEAGRTHGKVFKEKKRLEDLSITTIMRKPVVVDSATSIKKVTNLLQKNEEVIIKDGEKLCIVVPKDILELIARKPQKGVYVQITNIQDEDPFVAAKLDSVTTNFVQKIAKITKNIQLLALHVERHHKQGKKIKYSVRSRLLTDKGLLVSKAWGWELVTVAQEALSKLEREVARKFSSAKNHSAEKREKDLRR